MLKRWSLPASIALMLGAATTSAQTITATVRIPCVTPPEAEALVTTLLPDLMTNVSQICAPALPRGALLRRADDAFLARYRAEADRAWPQAQGALQKIAGPEAQGLLGNDLARPLLVTLVTPALTRNLQPADCPAVERIVALAQPLPPRSAAGLFIAVLQLADARRQDRSKIPLSICGPGGR